LNTLTITVQNLRRSANKTQRSRGEKINNKSQQNMSTLQKLSFPGGLTRKI